MLCAHQLTSLSPNDLGRGDVAGIVQASVVELEKDTCGESIVTVDLTEVGSTNVNSNLPKYCRDEVISLLSKYTDVISNKPGCTNSYVHEIKLTTTEPVRCKPYPIPINLRDKFDEGIAEMLSLGIIEPSSSPYCSPAIMVKKADTENYRVVLDYRALNDVTVFDAEPMPTVEDNYINL